MTYKLLSQSTKFSKRGGEAGGWGVVPNKSGEIGSFFEKKLATRRLLGTRE